MSNQITIPMFVNHISKLKRNLTGNIERERERESNRIKTWFVTNTGNNSNIIRETENNCNKYRNKESNLKNNWKKNNLIQLQGSSELIFCK